MQLQQKPSERALHPIIVENTKAFRITATAGTKLVGPSS